MEEERILSGYCRQLDGHRMVEVILEAGKAQSIDCDYHRCPFRGSCSIARELESALQP